MATTISLSLPDDLYRWLEEEAKKENKRIQQVIRELLEEIRMLRKYKLDKLVYKEKKESKLIEKFIDIIITIVLTILTICFIAVPIIAISRHELSETLIKIWIIIICMIGITLAIPRLIEKYKKNLKNEVA